MARSLTNGDGGQRYGGRVLPPVYFLVALLLMGGLHFAFPVRQIMEFPYRYIGMMFVEAVGEAGETMPQKSTLFYPRLQSGLVMREVDPNERP